MDADFLALIAKYGMETVLDIIGIWQKAGEPSLEEIKALKDLPDPESYFPEENQD